MPYVFSFLVMVNAGLLGYFIFLHNGTENTSYLQEKSKLTKEISFENSSDKIPPLIGEK